MLLTLITAHRPFGGLQHHPGTCVIGVLRQNFGITNPCGAVLSASCVHAGGLVNAYCFDRW
jgi:hypothetical protein